jgi:hypothetical protein
MKNMAFCDKGPSKTSLFYIYLNWTAWFICWCLKGSVFFLYLALVFQIISSPLSSEIRLCLDCWSKKKKNHIIKIICDIQNKKYFHAILLFWQDGKWISFSTSDADLVSCTIASGNALLCKMCWEKLFVLQFF